MDMHAVHLEDNLLVSNGSGLRAAVGVLPGTSNGALTDACSGERRLKSVAGCGDVQADRVDGGFPIQPSTIDLLDQQLVLDPPRWLTMLELERPRQGLRCLSWRTRFLKRCLDIVVAAGLLIVAVPIMLVAAIAIKLTSPGPIVFTQIRVGLNSRMSQRRQHQLDARGPCRRREPNFGRPFTIYKLRTMTQAAANSGPSEAVEADQRVTRAGRFLRRMRIDELPQLWNVLRGEMSMVGPRPECIEYMERLSAQVPGYLQRLGLKPGLTGIAQVEAGYANDLQSYRRKVAFDLMYLQNCSLWNDVKILAQTVRVVLTGFGAL
jgi:lipopolysaccharide/colanic/teichoic acid biosynthesis glycosyltransferase